MFENLLFLILGYLITGCLTDKYLELDKKIDVWRENHRIQKSLKKRIAKIKNENKEITMVSLKLAIADLYLRHNKKPISKKLLNSLSLKEYESYKKIGIIDSMCRINEPVKI